MAPVLAASEEIEADPVFVNAGEKLIPDPTVYSDWFSQVDERRQKLAVGARRYATIREITGGRPAWEDFIDPQTGRLLDEEELRQEGLMERIRRSGEVRRLIAERKQATANVAQFGFEPGTEPPTRPTPLVLPSSPPPSVLPTLVKPSKLVDPLKGHPFAGESREATMDAIRKRYNLARQGGIVAMDNPDPEGFNAGRHLPKDAEIIGSKVLADVQEYQQSFGGFRRPTIQQLFEKARETQPSLTIRQFQDVLAGLQKKRQLRLGPYTQALDTHPAPEFLMALDREFKFYAELP